MRSFVKKVAIIDTIVFIAVGIFSWLLTDLTFGVGLFGTGMALVFIGSLSAMGGNVVTPYEGLDARLEARESSYSFCLFMAAAAILPIAVGCLLLFL